MTLTRTAGAWGLLTSLKRSALERMFDSTNGEVSLACTIIFLCA
eukprot:COSAG01_NODE_19031_length_1035_cov_1.497863_3_plen_43_part_01